MFSWLMKYYDNINNIYIYCNHVTIIENIINNLKLNNILIIDDNIDNKIKGIIYSFLGLFYAYDKKYKNILYMKQYFIISNDLYNCNEAYVELANFYFNSFNYDIATKYFLYSVENHNNKDSMYLLGNIYFYFLNDYKKTIYYYEMAIKNGNKSPIYDLNNYFFNNKNYKLCKKYLLLGYEQKLIFKCYAKTLIDQYKYTNFIFL